MAPHSSTLAWRIPWTEEPGGLQSMGREESDTTERLPFHLSLSCFGEGNGNPLPCSCLDNPRDGGAWWAAVYGVAQSRTRLRWLSSSSSSSRSRNIIVTLLNVTDIPMICPFVAVLTNWQKSMKAELQGHNLPFQFTAEPRSSYQPKQSLILFLNAWCLEEMLFQVSKTPSYLLFFSCDFTNSAWTHCSLVIACHT